MAEFCIDCWNKINGTNDTKRKYALSFYAEICEECGECKRVIIAERFWFRKHRAITEAVDNTKKRTKKYIKNK